MPLNVSSGPCQGRIRHHFSSASLIALASLLLTGCFGDNDVVVADGSPSCTALSGSTWVPNVTGAAASNHDDDATDLVQKDVYTTSGNVVGFTQSAPARVVTISGINMDTLSGIGSTDLGTSGSISLVAELTSFPSQLQGSAYPMLISLHDGVNELVGIDLDPLSATYCLDNGMYSCVDSNGDGRLECSLHAHCQPDPSGNEGSAFLGSTAALRADQWEYRQGVGSGNNLSVNTFPTCNWTAGSPACHFSMAAASGGNFFSGGKLRAGAGVSYTAKYVIMADSYLTLAGSYSAGLKLSVIRKKDNNSAAVSNGAIDLNVIIVGNSNINDSRTAKGQQNLNELFNHVYEQFNAEAASSSVPAVDNGPKVRLGQINVIEWDCSNGGDAYATISSSDDGAMYRAASSLLPSATEGKAVNVFLVSSISGGSVGTIVGKSGGIPGAMVNGTTMSGVVFSSLDMIATYNPSCNGVGACPVASQETLFIDMGGTITHEIGHFLGLNHPSEASGAAHDYTPDTPQCTTKPAGGSVVTALSCATEAACAAACAGYTGSSGTACPSKDECQFNHVMWWTSKYRYDGNLFSNQSSAVINYSPYVQ